MSEFLGIDTKTLDDGGFQFFQTGLIRKALEATVMDNCNGLRTPTKVEAPLGTDTDGYEAEILDKLICFCYRDDIVSRIKYNTRYLLCCTPV